MALSLLSSYLVAVILLLITPGPVIALVTHTALREGYKRAFITLAGTNLASLVLLAMAVLILSGIVEIHPLSLTCISLAGALFIGAMAIQILTHSGTGEQTSTRPGGFITGFLTAIANPKDILFFVAFFPLFVPVTHNFAHSIALLTAIWIVLDLVILTLWIVGIRRYVSVKYERVIRFATAVFMLAVAVYGVMWNGKEILAALSAG
ncbi:LysE family translocator [Enterobacter sp. RHBSTW-00994]|uniref:LysE family translocator n=1 Tax=Enterobacter sp. RHBSTW-00994 TaxID=2742676 RepID=UPI0015EA681D|nr:LysE family translocator [Enterobacter sp. RHBSTW-00994]QLR43004.1 LysE family translocator [Enterobacter sp. RHBSTW-00994]